ncbi:MAG: roadblock/LC7 domain-containing protein [Spirochaetia bacterium]|nr:roadblock/LC7 domain-containing protein [Spirochaetia bacterium]
MDFKTVLQKIVENVDGAMGAAVIGEDGIAIDQFSTGTGFDVTAAGAEYSTIITSAKKASQSFGLGKTNEVLISTEKATMIMMITSTNYFVTLALSLDGNLGRGRLEMKKAIPELEKLL